MAILRLLFICLFFLHGLLHLLGFIKAFNVLDVSQLNVYIPKLSGLAWLLAAVLFIASFGLYVSGNPWWLYALVAISLSQLLVIATWTDARWATVANIIILLVAIADYAAYKYEQRFKLDVTLAQSITRQEVSPIISETDIIHLPVAIQRYLRYTGCIGMPRVNNFRVMFEGKIRKNNTSSWMPFTSVQYNIMNSASRYFFMKAKMIGLPVTGYHYYNAGKTFMDIRLLSLFKVQYQAGSIMDTAETVTFFNDMCCMAPATLMDARIHWLEADSNHVKAAFTNKGITITAVLYFNKDGALINFVSGDRYAAGDNGKMERIQWSTPLQEYTYINGYHIASYAETIYNYPAGDLIYGTFRLKELQYNVQ